MWIFPICANFNTFHYFTSVAAPASQTSNDDYLVVNHRSCVVKPLLAEKVLRWEDLIRRFDLNVAYWVQSSCPLRHEMQEVLASEPPLPPHATSCRPFSTTERECFTLPGQENKRMRGHLGREIKGHLGREKEAVGSSKLGKFQSLSYCRLDFPRLLSVLQMEIQTTMV